MTRRRTLTLVLLAVVAFACSTVSGMVRTYQNPPWSSQSYMTPKSTSAVVWTKFSPKSHGGCGHDKYCVRTRLHNLEAPAQFYEGLDRNLDDLIDQINMIEGWNRIDPMNGDCIGLEADYFPRDGRDWKAHWNPEDGRCRDFG